MNDQRTLLAKRANELSERYKTEMRGRMVPSTKALRIKRELNDVLQQIADLDAEAANRLALEKAPIDEVLEVIALPLLADVMNDVVAGVDAMLRRNGCQETVFSLYTRQIRKAAMAMVDTLQHGEEHLPDLLAVDDTLVDAVKKKLMSFIKQRLNITK